MWLPNNLLALCSQYCPGVPWVSQPQGGWRESCQGSPKHGCGVRDGRCLLFSNSRNQVTQQNGGVSVQSQHMEMEQRLTRLPFAGKDVVSCTTQCLEWNIEPDLYPGTGRKRTWHSSPAVFHQTFLHTQPPDLCLMGLASFWEPGRHYFVCFIHIYKQTSFHLLKTQWDMPTDRGQFHA